MDSWVTNQSNKVAAGFSTYLRVVILVDHINQIRTVDLESWIVMKMRRRCFNADQKTRAWKFDRGREEEGD